VMPRLERHVTLTTVFIFGVIWDDVHFSKTSGNHDIFRECLEVWEAIGKTIDDKRFQCCYSERHDRDNEVKRQYVAEMFNKPQHLPLFIV
jgi:hypothetical protein